MKRPYLCAIVSPVHSFTSHSTARIKLVRSPWTSGDTITGIREILCYVFGYVNVNSFTSAVDVYQVLFSVFRVYYVTFYT